MASSQKEKWFQAIEDEDYDTIRSMIENGFDFNIENDEGKNAYAIAMDYDDEELMEIIEEYDTGNDNDESDEQEDEECEGNDEGENEKIKWFNAIITENINIIKKMIDEGFNINTINDQWPYSDKTALMITAEKNNFELVDFLLTTGCDVNLSGNTYENAITCCLNGAINKNTIKIIQKLIDFGCVINEKNEIHDINNLNEAARIGQIDIVNLFLEKHAALDNDSLLKAIESKNLEIVKLFVNKGIPINDEAIFLASEKGTIEIIRFFIEQGIDFKKEDKSGRTTLSYACKNNDSNIVKMFIEMGMDVNKKDEYGKTPLVYAVEEGGYDILKLLYDKGADLNIKVDSGNILIHAMNNTIASNKNNEHEERDIIEFLIQHGINPEDVDNNGANALMYAAHNSDMGDNGKLVTILSKYIKDINATDNTGSSALIYAAEQGNYKNAKCLLEKGADVNIQNEDGKTALDYAEEDDDFKRLAQILRKYQRKAEKKKADNEYTTKHLKEWFDNVENGDYDGIENMINNGFDIDVIKDGKTALMIASQNQNSEIIQLIIENNADVDIQGSENKTALLFLLDNLSEGDDHSNIIECFNLLNEYDADTEISDNNGYTALMRAANGGSYDIAESILDISNESINYEDKDEKTALMYSSVLNEIDITELLLKYGANVNAKDKNGWTSLMRAAYNGQNYQADLLIDKGANVNQQDEDGNTALMWVYDDDATGADYMVDLLLNAGSDVNIKNNNGDTILTFISGDNEWGEKSNIVETILLNNAEINAQNNEGKTALIRASESSFLDTVKILINNNADANIKDKYGKTALNYAIENNNAEIINLLKKVTTTNTNNSSETLINLVKGQKVDLTKENKRLKKY